MKKKGLRTKQNTNDKCNQNTAIRIHRSGVKFALIRRGGKVSEGETIRRESKKLKKDVELDEGK